jgi:hypothetical protein
MATKPLISIEELVNRYTAEEWRERIRAHLAVPRGGCDACRFEDPFSERLCTIPDISAEDFDLGVHGINCSRFHPREEPSENTSEVRVDTEAVAR